MGIFPLSFDPSPGTASIGELRERCKKIGCAREQEKTQECLFIFAYFCQGPKGEKGEQGAKVSESSEAGSFRKAIEALSVDFEFCS